MHNVKIVCPINQFKYFIHSNRFNTFIKNKGVMSYYKIDNFEQYFKHYNKSIREPRKFWGKIAEENFTWYQQWDKVVDFDMENADIKWFTEAKVNIVKNCIDRHLAKREKKQRLFLNRIIQTNLHCTSLTMNSMNVLEKWPMC